MINSDTKKMTLLYENNQAKKRAEQKQQILKQLREAFDQNPELLAEFLCIDWGGLGSKAWDAAFMQNEIYRTSHNLV